MILIQNVVQSKISNVTINKQNLISVDLQTNLKLIETQAFAFASKQPINLTSLLTQSIRISSLALKTIQNLMIQLYAILHNFEDVLEMQIPNKSNKDSLLSLFKHIEKKIKSQGEISKLIKSMKIQNYLVYYFRQDQFVFIIVTTDGNKTERVHNYLRVIAEIFYENYDEKKFHIILERIIKQINRIESPNQDKPLTFEEQETFLGQSTLPQYKQKINLLMEKRSKESKRVYVIMSILFIAIFVLLMIFICKKWC